MSIITRSYQHGVSWQMKEVELEVRALLLKSSTSCIPRSIPSLVRYNTRSRVPVGIFDAVQVSAVNFLSLFS